MDSILPLMVGAAISCIVVFLAKVLIGSRQSHSTGQTAADPPLGGILVNVAVGKPQEALAMSNIVDVVSEGPSEREASLIDLASPKRFRDGSGPQWHDYVETLKVLDAIWRDRKFRNTSFGVLGPQPSWEDTIARGGSLFEVDSWAILEEDQVSMIAPTHFFADGDALLGSIGRRSKDVCSFLFEPEAANDRDRVLSLLKQARSLSAQSIPLAGGEILAEMCAIRGMGRAFATRLLALARPDGFVVVNNKSADWLRQATGLALTGKRRSYRHLLEWLDGQAWYHAAEPTDDPIGRRLWGIRAAVLDAFAYEPLR